MKIWTCERVARYLGCSPQQIKRYCELNKIPCYRSSSDGMQSMYSYRINEEDLLQFFNCKTLEDFNQVRYH
ncbi:helix-turn-helix domain-containing protein [Paenibacillus odorifer]|uniref:helix-turn-helix domain-containing protein n=1 Tax=Paenibacillus odorifer TaxID=189426 RepID=UPI00096D21AA